jgi:hypothetical protein
VNLACVRREEEGLVRELKWEESERDRQKENEGREIENDGEMVRGGVNEKRN